MRLSESPRESLDLNSLPGLLPVYFSHPLLPVAICYDSESTENEQAAKCQFILGVSVLRDIIERIPKTGPGRQRFSEGFETVLLIFRDRIFDSRVDRGMPSLVAALVEGLKTALHFLEDSRNHLFFLSGKLFGEAQRTFRLGRKRLPRWPSLVDREIRAPDCRPKSGKFPITRLGISPPVQGLIAEYKPIPNKSGFHPGYLA
jgi:hypothetical protein